jgi:hypothetical protein
MTLHTKISYLKSFARILGYLALLVDIKVAVVVLVGSELLGIIEELPGTYRGTSTK